MQFSTNRSDFAGMLGRVVPVISKKSTSPIFESILITVDGGKITLTGSSDGAQITTSISTLDAIDGSLAVNAHTLAAIFRKLPDSGKPVSIEAKDGHVIVKSGRSRFKLPVLDARDYPDFVSAGSLDATISVNSAKLVACLTKSSAAMGKEEARYYLMGLSIRSRDAGPAIFCSTDGHRLIRCQTEFDFGIAVDAILPRSAVEYLSAHLGTDGDVEVGISRNVMTFSKGDFSYRTKLYDATFPDYERIIPKEDQVIFEGFREQLITAMDVVSPVQEAATRGVTFGAVDGGLSVQASSDAHSEGATEVDGSTGSFADVMKGSRLGLNGEYLGSILKVIASETVQLRSNGPMSPVRILCDDDSFASVIMPLRV